MTQTSTPQPNASAQMVQKMAAAGDAPLLDSEFIALDQYKDGDGNPTPAERTLGSKGFYVSSPANGWALSGPFGGPQ